MSLKIVKKFDIVFVIHTEKASTMQQCIRTWWLTDRAS